MILVTPLRLFGVQRVCRNTASCHNDIQAIAMWVPARPPVETLLPTPDGVQPTDAIQPLAPV
jgi:hypothetical protein